jgi:hypothetical protein
MTTNPEPPTPDSSASPRAEAAAADPTLPPLEAIETPEAWSVPIAVWRLAPQPAPAIPDQAPDTAPDASGDPTDPATRPHENRPRPQPNADHDRTYDDRTRDDRFVSRLAHWLVLTLTNRDETVVDLDGSTNLRDAAAATGRHYLPLTDPTRVADLDALDHPIGLILFRWPRHPDPSTRPPRTPPTDTTGTTNTLASRERKALSPEVRDLFLACKVMSTAHTCVVATIHPTTRFAAHERTLRSAAQAVGLRHIMTIVALPAPGDGDEFLYYATPGESSQLHPDPDATPDPEGDPGWHVDLLLFTPPTPPSSPPTVTDDTTAADPAPDRRPLTGDHA